MGQRVEMQQLPIRQQSKQTEPVIRATRHNKDPVTILRHTQRCDTVKPCGKPINQMVGWLKRTVRRQPHDRQRRRPRRSNQNEVLPEGVNHLHGCGCGDADASGRTFLIRPGE